MKKLFLLSLAFGLSLSLSATDQVRSLGGYDADLQVDSLNTGSYETDSTIVTYVYVGSKKNTDNRKIINDQYYLKLSKDTAYVKIALKEGAFLEGDSVVACIGHTSKEGFTTGLYVKNDKSVAGTNKFNITVAAKNTPSYGHYILKAEDINEDGSVSFYRVDAQVFLHSIDIYRIAKDPTALERKSVEARPIKTMHNGQLVILKDNVRYNALGNEVNF